MKFFRFNRSVEYDEDSARLEDSVKGYDCLHGIVQEYNDTIMTLKAHIHETECQLAGAWDTELARMRMLALQAALLQALS